MHSEIFWGFAVILKRIFLRIFGAFIALLTIPLVTLLGVVVADYIYNSTHAIPDPVARGDDLGTGLAAFLGLLVGFVFSLPVSFLAYKLVVTKKLRSMQSEQLNQ